MKKLATILLAAFLPLLVIAQRDKDELSRKIAGKKNLQAIMKIVEKHFAEEKKQEQGREANEEFENEYLHWKRWEYYNKSRLKANGDLEDITAKTEEAWRKTEAKYGSASRPQSGTNASWNFVGPWANNYQAGFYRGLSRVDRIVFHPTDVNTLFAGAPNGGLWRSTNNGLSWDIISFYFPINSVAGIAVSQQNASKIYAITGDANGGGVANGVPTNNSAGIWVTYDGGTNWYKTNFNANRQSSVWNGYKLLVDPTNDNIVLAATAGGLFRSADGGNTWTQVIFNGIFDIEFDPSDANRVYASASSTFYYSTDNGVTFPAGQRTSLPGKNRIEIGVSPNNTNYVYLLCGPYGGGIGTNTFGGVYRSTDKGVSFSLRANTPNVLCQTTNGILGGNDGDQSGYDLAIAVSPSNAEDVFVAGKIIWRSTNGGTTFSNITPFNEGSQNPTPPANYIHPDVHDLAFNPLNGTFYATTDGGVYRTVNNGANWTDISNIHATTFNHMAAAAYDVNKIMAGCQDNGVKYKRDAGDFTHINGADGFDCSFGNSAGVGMYASINNILSRYDINGNSLAITTPAGTSFYPVIIADPVNANTVYMASGGTGVMKSTNNGGGWTQVLNIGVGTSLAMSPANGNRVYAASSFSIYRTDNGGANWSGDLTNNPGFVPTGQLTDVNVCPGNSDFVYVTVGGYSAGQKVFYSNDAGANWFNISGTLPAEVKVNCVVVDVFNNAYIGTDMGVYYQAVSSSDWTPYYNELPRIPVYDLAIHAGSAKLRAGTFGHGVWETDLYTACDANLVLTGTVFGAKFFQVSNQVVSNATIAGADNTNVTTRAGNEIVLSDGFTVPERNTFSAILGACESGPVVTGGRAAATVPSFMQQMDPGDSTGLYIYGMVTVMNPLQANSIIHVEAYKEGQYTVLINDAGTGNNTITSFNQYLQPGAKKDYPLSTVGIPAGKYYMQLYYAGKLVHVQELFVK